MATPYLQLWVEEVPSTQDLARTEARPSAGARRRRATIRGSREGEGQLGSPHHEPSRSHSHSAPPLTTAALLTDGGLGGSPWPGRCQPEMAQRLDVRWRQGGGDPRGSAAAAVVVGMGVNLWWPGAPEGIGALHDHDPGAGLHARIAGLWAAELMCLLEGDGWPIDEYRSRSSTLGKRSRGSPRARGTRSTSPRTEVLWSRSPGPGRPWPQARSGTWRLAEIHLDRGRQRRLEELHQSWVGVGRDVCVVTIGPDIEE